MRTLLLGAIALLTACATAYGPDTGAGGYRDWQTAPGRYHVEVALTPGIDAETARYYFHRRSMELCQGEGYRGYAMAPASGMDRPSRWVVGGDIACQ